MTMFEPEPPPAPQPLRRKPLEWLRNWFITGIVVSAPIGITIWLVWSFVTFVDNRIKPLIPARWNPETYLQFALPGLGIVIAVVGLTLLGALTANLIGKSLIRAGERIVNRVPLVRSVYSVLKQVFETFASQEASSFKEAVLIQFPREGIWTVAFITNRRPGGEIAQHVQDAVAVFVPNAPNPATGFILYVTPDQIRPLKMTVEQAAKLVFSVGILTPEVGAAEQAPADVGAPDRSLPTGSVERGAGNE